MSSPEASHIAAFIQHTAKIGAVLAILNQRIAQTGHPFHPSVDVDLEDPESFDRFDSEGLFAVEGVSFGEYRIDDVRHPQYTDEVQRLSPFGVFLPEIHRAARTAAYEEMLWDYIIWLVGYLPEQIALDLVDRDLCCDALAYSNQSDKVLWRLFDRSEGAQRQLAYRRYINPEWDWVGVEEVLHQCEYEEDLLVFLVEWLASDSEKAESLARHICSLDQEIQRSILGKPFPPTTKDPDPLFFAAWEKVQQQAQDSLS